MRKIILFILVLGQISFAIAQSLVVTGGTSFNDDPNVQIAHHLDIKNTSANTITIECQKTNLTLPLGAASFYCFAGNCYSSSSINPSSSAVLAPGQEISFNNSPPDTDAHSGYYDAYGASGVAEVQYCFYDVNNFSDETCVIITYECSGATTYARGICLARGKESYECTNITLDSAIALPVVDSDWKWDEFRDPNSYGNIWGCRGTATGQFSDESKCLGAKNDNTWPN